VVLLAPEVNSTKLFVNCLQQKIHKLLHVILEYNIEQIVISLFLNGQAKWKLTDLLCHIAAYQLNMLQLQVIGVTEIRMMRKS